MTMIQLNDQQAAGLEKVKEWYEFATADMFAVKVFRWFGYAGTGKTFTAARIPEALGLKRVVFGTYTGKAASVLRRSLAAYGMGHLPVSTIHSAIYQPTTSRAAREALEECREEIAALESGIEAEEGPAPDLVKQLATLQARLPKLEADARRLRFELNPEGAWADAELIILDEVSMVNGELAADIESYGVPILVLGDPAQLPPVEGGGHYTSARPDVLLTKIERQAIEGNPIVELATRVRESQDESLGLRVRDMERPSLRRAMEADMVLVWTNRRRWKMIHAMRTALGRPEAVPVAGDVIMNLTNNKDAAVFNGQMFTVLEARPAKGKDQKDDPRMGWDMMIRTEDGQERPLLAYAEGFISQEEQVLAKNANLGMDGERLLCTFAQAITVHKAQGSEAERVYVVNETPKMLAAERRKTGERAAVVLARRWLYTAVTRARTEVIISRPS